MQLCKCINCFLKAHNKQLNQYCLNFTIFLPKKKKSFKKRVRVESGWPAKNTARVTGQPVFASGQKNGVRVRSSQKILTHFAMSNNERGRLRHYHHQKKKTHTTYRKRTPIIKTGMATNLKKMVENESKSLWVNYDELVIEGKLALTARWRSKEEGKWEIERAKGEVVGEAMWVSESESLRSWGEQWCEGEAVSVAMQFKYFLPFLSATAWINWCL